MIKRFVYFAFLEQKPGEIEMGIGIVGMCGNSVPVVRDCLVRFTTILQGDGKIVIGHPTTRIRRKRSSIKSDCVEILCGLMKRQNAKYEQGRTRKSKPRNFFELIGRHPNRCSDECEGPHARQVLEVIADE